MRNVLAVLLLSLSLGSAADAAEFVEAEYLALELTNELLPPTPVVVQIGADLAAVRATYDFFEGITARPDWRPGALWLFFGGTVADEFVAGNHAALNALNDLYGPLSWTQFPWNPHWFTFEFERPYHSVQLAAIYTQIHNVLAEPEYTVGDGSDVTTRDLGTYEFKLGWHDCPAGCLYSHYWLFHVADGVVTLIDEWGDPVSVPVEATTWGRLKSRFQSSPGRR